MHFLLYKVYVYKNGPHIGTVFKTYQGAFLYADTTVFIQVHVL